MKNIAVVGTGYVGLVTGTCFAEMGNQVICIDNNQHKVAQMQAGNIPIYEPELDVLFERNIKAGRLHFTTNLAEGIAQAEIIFLALPTPPGADGAADLSFVLGVAEELGKLITDYKVIVDKSTVPVGTAEKVNAAISTRSGFMKSETAKPSRKNSGLDTTANSVRAFLAMAACTFSAVPTGTVLLSTMTL